MLELDSLKWSELQSDHGSSEGVPEALALLYKDPQNEVAWHTLWSSLYHSSNVFTASYAALPHIVKIALESKTETVGMNFFLLPASIEIARMQGRGPAIPIELEPAYTSAMYDLGMFADSYHHINNENLKKSAKIAHLVSAGHIEKAKTLIEEHI